MSRLEERKPTAKVPHHKSDNARLAAGRGERVWTSWTLRRLIDDVLKLNERDVAEKDLRSVKCLEYLRVKLLEPTEEHQGLLHGSVTSQIACSPSRLEGCCCAQALSP